MKKITCYLILSLLIMPSALQAKYYFNETFCIPLPYLLSHWKLGFQQEQRSGSLAKRYILENENMENWSQLVNVQFQARRLVKCSDAVEAMQKEVSLNEGIKFKIHSQSSHDVTFEKVFPTGMHELVRMVMTDKGLHRIAYVKREAPFTELDRSQWLERLQQGAVEKVE